MKTWISAKLHGLTVTQADLNYRGSITIDADLLDAVGIEPYEQVHVLNVTNGARLVTYAIAGARKSGICCLNGAAARHVAVGDKVLVLTYRMEQRYSGGKVAVLGDKNQIVESFTYDPPRP